MRGLEATFEPGVGARTLDRNNTVYGDLNMKERRSFKACGGASLRGKLRERASERWRLCERDSHHERDSRGRKKEAGGASSESILYLWAKSSSSFSEES